MKHPNSQMQVRARMLQLAHVHYKCAQSPDSTLVGADKASFLAAATSEVSPNGGVDKVTNDDSDDDDDDDDDCGFSTKGELPCLPLRAMEALYR